MQHRRSLCNEAFWLDSLRVHRPNTHDLGFSPRTCRGLTSPAKKKKKKVRLRDCLNCDARRRKSPAGAREQRTHHGGRSESDYKTCSGKNERPSWYTQRAAEETGLPPKRRRRAPAAGFAPMPSGRRRRDRAGKNAR